MLTKTQKLSRLAAHPYDLAGGQDKKKGMPGFSLTSPHLWALRLRLCLFFALLLISVWLFSAFMAWLEGKEYRGYINEFYDTQQILLAKRLASTDFSTLAASRPLAQTELREEISNSNERFHKDALAFAVFTNDGKTVLTDGHKGNNFIFRNNSAGFVNSSVYGSDDFWRIVWTPSADGNFVIAVGQMLDQRDDIFQSMLMQQIRPWVLLLPLLLFGLFWILSRELAPLRAVTTQLETRHPEDTSPLYSGNIPADVRPMVKALNSLFTRIGNMIQRERAFISDAAHELRTPLTALRIQAEVARLAINDRESLDHALKKLLCGIDKSTQLVEQLLMLSRLETMHDLDSTELSADGIDWLSMLDELVMEHKTLAGKKRITLNYLMSEEPREFKGYPVLLTLLLRNLLDNAVKYTPENGLIQITLEKHCLTIENSGPGVPDTFLPRLCERFARPPGQAGPGSGLGLSIAQRAAAINRLDLSLHNRPGEYGGGFVARLHLP